MSFFPNILLTTDAHQYGILANNLLHGKGYTLAGIPETIFPPGYDNDFFIPIIDLLHLFIADELGLVANGIQKLPWYMEVADYIRDFIYDHTRQKYLMKSVKDLLNDK